MIRHICMFKLKETGREEHLAEFLRRAQDLTRLPSVSAASVVRNAPGTPDSNYDVSLIFDFENVQRLEEYQSSPTHVEFGKFVGEIRESRACIDYEF